MVTHPVSRAVGLLGRRGLVLGWAATTQTHTHTELSSESQKHEPCRLAFHLMDQFRKITHRTNTQTYKYSLSVQFVVAVFAVHRYGCSDDGQQYDDSDDGSYDAACGSTLLWKTSTCINKTKRREKIP